MKNLLPGILSLFIFFCGTSFAQNVSNEGTEFYAVFPTHVPATLGNGFRPLANYSIFITGKQNSSGQVSVGSFRQSFTVTANQVTQIDIPRDQAYIDATEANQTRSNKAIKVTVNPGQPKVVVYGHIFAGARSAASLILPVQALGQRYFTMNYYASNARDTGDNFIVIVASEPNTKIYLKRNGTDLVPGGITLANAGDVYEYLVRSDITGTEVTVDQQTSSCKRFAVFSGNTNSLIGTPACAGNSSDPLYQQNYPVESWGMTYGFIPFSMQSPTGVAARINGSYYRILAKDNDTQVKVNGTVVATLGSGQFYQPANPSITPALITANKPIAVAQYALTQSCAGGNGVSDPDMVILNPVEYNIKNITVYSSPRENISQQYINVLIKTTAAGSFRVNGTVPTKGFTVLSSAPEYSYLTLPLNDFNSNNLFLSASDGFNAIAYGFGDVESYAYSAGTNLATNQTLVAVRKNRTEELSNACTYENFEFKVVLPEVASKLTWNFGNQPQIVQNNPTGTLVQKNDKTAYEYYYPKTEIFTTPGQRLVKIYAEYTGGTSCTIGSQEIEILFDVFNPSTPLFNGPGIACPGEPVLFEDRSIADGEEVTTWIWNFGDGTTSNEQNPKHVFKNPGTYNVKLNAYGASACQGGTYEKQIIIREKPQARFNISGGTCESNTLVFSDASSASEGNIIKWIWKFTEKDSVVATDNQPISFTFPKAGKYPVSLMVENSEGCISDVFIDTARAFAPFLEAGADRFVLKGGKTTLLPVVEGNIARYFWSPSDDLSSFTVANPTITPTETRTYRITITTEEGCVLTDSLKVTVLEKFDIYNTFTPNGDGINDAWVIKYLDTYTEATVNIFNRFGDKVFSSVGYIQPWDGRLNGKDLPVGTYYYVIDTKMEQQKVYSGSVTILR